MATLDRKHTVIGPDGSIVTTTNTGDASKRQQDRDNLINEYEEDSRGNGGIAKLLRANGIFRREDFDDYNRFYLFPRNDPYRMLGTTREYVFFTKPDLHIFNNGDVGTLNDDIVNDPFFKDLHDRGYNKTILKDLQYSTDGYMVPFITILSNYKTSNLELQSINSEDMESPINMYGTRLSYRNSSYRSDEYVDFSIEFKDNRYLDCYLWFKAYDAYERKKAEGRITPVHEEYIWNKIISDQMTIFKFVVGEDGETLVHWSCIWGCYPKSVPRETFSDLPADGQLRFTVNWHGSFQDDMDPVILSHFNWLCKQQFDSGSLETMDLYDEDIQAVTGEYAITPYIEGPYTSGITDYKQYRLIWKKFKTSDSKPVVGGGR